jgi:murein DD-endopeptidase MepM/ murein hydrolase activator NlpD
VTRGSMVVRLLRAVVPTGLLLVAFALVTSSRQLEAFSRTSLPLEPVQSFDPSDPAAGALPGAADVVTIDSEDRERVELTLGRGETLDALLSRLSLEPPESQAVVAAFREHCDLRRLRPGASLASYLGPGDLPMSFELKIRGKGRVVVERASAQVGVGTAEAGGWTSRLEEFVEERRVRRVSGRVDGSLTAAVARAGGPASLAYAMADVLQWDLDFNRDLRRGDRFAVLFEEVYLDGELQGVGDVLALEYDNRGQRLEAYRYGKEPAYFDGEGRPLQKMFLRSPLPFSRVTSRFTNRRFHPVLKVYRPHHGVDYGAPTGTAVRATARGTVTLAGWSGGGGNTVKVRHANGYLTAYLHLSRFAEGVRPGARIAQGDVIGYVGSTGLATGPHLDYRVQRNGRWVDPLGLDNVEAEPLTTAELEGFLGWRDALRDSLVSGEAPAQPSPEGDLRLANQGGSDPADARPALRTAG